MAVEMRQIGKAVFRHGGINISGPFDGLLGTLHFAVQKKLIRRDAGMALELTDKLIFGQAKFLTKVIQLQHMIHAGVHHFFRFLHKSIVLPPRCGDLRLRHKASQLE
ncbi:hypothetical protein D3C75_881310 [compost metagenome]